MAWLYEVLKVLEKLYEVLTKYEAVYLFYLVPIAYFMSIVIRLIYYKLRYHQQIYFRDIIAVATMILIFLDYVNYLRLLITGTGRILPFTAFVIKYALGFLLWAWMFWYSYKVHLKRNWTVKNLKKRWAVIAFIGTMCIILVVIGIVVSQ
jgi:hypothetical protein